MVILALFCTFTVQITILPLLFLSSSYQPGTQSYFIPSRVRCDNLKDVKTLRLQSSCYLKGGSIEEVSLQVHRFITNELKDCGGMYSQQSPFNITNCFMVLKHWDC